MLRPYQTKTLEAIKENYTKGVHRQLAVAATGTGKTVTFAHIPEVMKDVLPGQTLVLIHREEILDQNVKKLKLYNPNVTVTKEMGTAVGDENADIIVASTATLGRKGTKRAARFDWDKITKVITDECHHSTAASYLNLYELADVLRPDTHKLHVGFTATPTRGNGEGLHAIYDKIVFSYGMRQAIEEGYLTDVKGIRVTTNTCLDYVKTTGGKFDETELANTVNTPGRNQLIAKAWLDNAKGLKTVIFTVDIKHAQNLAAMLCEYGVKAEAVWGEDSERADKIARLESGETEVLTNCGVLTEGWDCPAVACIVLARPTRSGVFFAQAVGRGTRLFEGKEILLVIDVVDAYKKNTLLTVPTLFGMSASLDLKGQSLVESVKQLEQAQKDFPHIDFNTLPDISQLQSYIQSVNLFEIHFDETVTENSKLSWYPSATGGYVLMLPNKESIQIAQNLLDRWEVFGTIKGKKYRGDRESLDEIFSAADGLVQKACPEALKILNREEKWHGDPATEGQLKTLKKFYKGKAIPPDLTKGAASRIIGSYLAGKA